VRKLIQGIVNFRRTARLEQRTHFARLARGQAPDAMLIACSDSRVVPNLFASTDPGDLFVMRNVGNMVPPGKADGTSKGDISEAAAVEFAVVNLMVRNIIVCGHSECGAMKSILEGDITGLPNLDLWLHNGHVALDWLKTGKSPDPTLTTHNQLSQLNVLLQMEHLLTYPCVKERIEQGAMGLFGWYFDIGHADVYAYEQSERHFVLIDETEGERLIARMSQ
jgi:carbonic anhydrase